MGLAVWSGASQSGVPGQQQLHLDRKTHQTPEPESVAWWRRDEAPSTP